MGKLRVTVQVAETMWRNEVNRQSLTGCLILTTPGKSQVETFRASYDSGTPQDHVEDKILKALFAKHPKLYEASYKDYHVYMYCNFNPCVRCKSKLQPLARQYGHIMWKLGFEHYYVGLKSLQYKTETEAVMAMAELEMINGRLGLCLVAGQCRTA